jgi:hypothetical protein
MSTRVDEALDAAANRLQSFVAQSQRAGGLKAKLGEALEDDPAFLRKLKPSLIAARARGRTPAADRVGGNGYAAAPPEPGEAPSEVSRPRGPQPTKGGASPWLVLGAALVFGMLAAKAIDWRSHAHPRG